jgi:hypothetical protein
VPQERSGELIRSIEHWSGSNVDSELLAFCRVAYLAFRLGSARLGAIITADGAERARIEARGNRYAAELQHVLQSSRAATRLESLFD